MALKKAIVVNVIPLESNKEKEFDKFEELTRLVETYGGIVILKVLQKRGRPSAKTFLGPGKTVEVGELVKSLKADMLIVNNFLKANQINSLRKIVNCDVWDRFDLILNIFDKNARTKIAKLQIELTRLKYEFPRLFGKGTSLSQQAGFTGLRSGPGEKLLEIKRRHLRNKIQTIEKKLEAIREVHKSQRKRRERNGMSVIALVGYTNSGKTTLLKTLTNKQNLVIANQLFSTLDTRFGRLWLEGLGKEVILADTIGFIRDLPTLLFESFLTTLEEVKEADMLLHVIDTNDPDIKEQMEVVKNIIKQLGCENKPKIYVFNKIDLALNSAEIMKHCPSKNSVFISAQKKQNLDQLKHKIQTLLKSIH